MTLGRRVLLSISWSASRSAHRSNSRTTAGTGSTSSLPGRTHTMSSAPAGPAKSCEPTVGAVHYPRHHAWWTSVSPTRRFATRATSSPRRRHTQYYWSCASPVLSLAYVDMIVLNSLWCSFTVSGRSLMTTSCPTKQSNFACVICKLAIAMSWRSLSSPAAVGPSAASRLRAPCLLASGIIAPSSSSTSAETKSSSA